MFQAQIPEVPVKHQNLSHLVILVLIAAPTSATLLPWLMKGAAILFISLF